MLGRNARSSIVRAIATGGGFRGNNRTNLADVLPKVALGHPQSHESQKRPPFIFLLIDGHGAMGPKAWSSARGQARTHARIRGAGRRVGVGVADWAN
jgi:hypothetical protein